MGISAELLVLLAASEGRPYQLFQVRANNYLNTVQISTCPRCVESSVNIIIIFTVTAVH